jgi:tryptophan-rich sensory protein
MSLNESNREWYNSINKSPLTPPNYVFGIVWPLLYVMIIGSGVDFFSQTNKETLTTGLVLYTLQWILNLSWSPLFFRYKQISLSLLVILSLVATVIGTIYVFGTQSTLSAWLLVPYLVWISFASYLNGYIWYNN